MLTPALNTEKKEALYIQLYRHIKKEITDGKIQRHEKLPSKRSLADHLGISVNTVTNAYEALLDEGYIYSEERSGFYISDIDNLLIPRSPEADTPTVPDIAKTHKKVLKSSINSVDTENFPVYTFKKVITEIMSGNNTEWLKEHDFQGLAPLRKAIRDYIYSARDVKTSPDNIVISSGIEYLLQILFYILPQKSTFGLENPGSPAIRDLCRSNRKKCRLLRLDGRGITPADAEKCDVLLVTPSHQFPTGILMPIQRRVEILNLMGQKKNGYIIEDDYDSEFKYYGKPIPALKSLDRTGSVIYIGNFSKSISPSLRLSFMVLPDKLLKKYYEIPPFINCPVSNLIQLATAKFIEDGYFERHLNRMKLIYHKKRKAAIALLKKYPGMKIIDKKAGLHLLVEAGIPSVPGNSVCRTEKQIVKQLHRDNIDAEALSNYYLNQQPDYSTPRILIPFGAAPLHTPHTESNA